MLDTLSKDMDFYNPRVSRVSQIAMKLEGVTMVFTPGHIVLNWAWFPWNFPSLVKRCSTLKE